MGIGGNYGWVIWDGSEIRIGSGAYEWGGRYGWGWGIWHFFWNGKGVSLEMEGTIPFTNYVRITSEICQKLTIKTSKRRHWSHSVVFVVNSEKISHLFWCFHCRLEISKCRSGKQETLPDATWLKYVNITFHNFPENMRFNHFH